VALSLSIASVCCHPGQTESEAAPAYKTFMIGPMRCAGGGRRCSGIFMFQPRSAHSRGLCARWASTGILLLNGNHALILVVMAAVWKQISYNFLFFLAGLQSIPKKRHRSRRD